MDDRRLTPAGAVEIQQIFIKGRHLLVWTIFDHPRDMPGLWVARPYSSRHGGPLSCYLAAGTLDELRGMLPPGLVRMVRQDRDEPQIVETWF